MKPDPSQARVRELFDYDPYPSHMIKPLIRLKNVGNVKKGTRVGTFDISDMIYYVRVDRKRMSLHRLVWIWHNGPIPCNMDIRRVNTSFNTIAGLRMIKSLYDRGV